MYQKQRTATGDINPDEVILLSSNTTIPRGSALWRDYQAWLDDGNLPADALAIVVSADAVRAEAQRRIISLVGASSLDGCLIKQLNALMRATELTNKRAAGSTWTPQETAEAAGLQGMADAVKAIRAASNAMEPNPPADYKSDSRWP